MHQNFPLSAKLEFTLRQSAEVYLRVWRGALSEE